MTRRIFAFLAAIAVLPAASHAHPGHVADLGQGHSHWLAVAILGGLAIACAAWGITRVWRSARRERRRA